ncbi:MAG: glycosyltransferase family 4 protein [Leptolyngbyaceae cyanobacterium bins.59]|nr:glycosyltransferase family 4 protein [Leptolyngbyaceae cyanobacterium bins.59]
MGRPLRILMVCHMPWSRNAGGSRVQLELADEFRKLGHTVEKFSYEDAFPRPLSRWEELFTDFCNPAQKFVREYGRNFDVIDAHQGNLPRSKQDLGFQGLLVARTVGLYTFVEEFMNFERKQWPTLKPSLGGAFLRWLQFRFNRHCYTSLKFADVLNLPNRDEQSYVQERWGFGQKAFVFPFGLTETRLAVFSQIPRNGADRLRNPQIAFVGGWQTRKGSKDWPEIVRRIRASVPQARFLFLGTGVDRQRLLASLAPDSEDGIEVIPTYDSDDLPHLLSQVTVGAFPSYMEGFGFSVLEKLAAGAPVVAYDVPGPREMLSLLDPSYLVPRGDVVQFCDRILEVLGQDEATYAQISDRCQEVAHHFCWTRIAQETLAVYSKFLP